jgi:hypothetical protein
VSWRSDDFIGGLGLPEPEGEPHVLFSRGVQDVRLGMPSLRGAESGVPAGTEARA